MTLLKSLSALTLALSIGAAPTFAQTIDLGANTGASATVGSDTSVDAGASADVETQVAEEENESSTSETSSASFNLSRLDASVTANTGATVTASSVTSDSDLEAYAASTLRADESFEGIEVNDEGLTFRFTEDTRLFGFIPHKLTSRISVDSDGSVRIERPWYHFLAAGISADTTASVESRVRAAVAASGSLDARTKAVVLSEIASALSGSAGASAEASAY